MDGDGGSEVLRVLPTGHFSGLYIYIYVWEGVEKVKVPLELSTFYGYIGWPPTFTNTHYPCIKLKLVYSLIIMFQFRVVQVYGVLIYS